MVTEYLKIYRGLSDILYQAFTYLVNQQDFHQNANQNSSLVRVVSQQHDAFHVVQKLYFQLLLHPVFSLICFKELIL